MLNSKSLKIKRIYKRRTQTEDVTQLLTLHPVAIIEVTEQEQGEGKREDNPKQNDAIITSKASPYPDLVLISQRCYGSIIPAKMLYCLAVGRPIKDATTSNEHTYTAIHRLLSEGLIMGNKNKISTYTITPKGLQKLKYFCGL